MLRKINILKYFGVIWAIIGLTLVFTWAIVKLAPHSIEAVRVGLSFDKWIILLAWCGFMLFAEGYRGFQKQFSPRFASRALYLFNNPYNLHLVLAPLFCIGYFYATRRLKLTAWLLTLIILLLAFTVRYITQPWQGIIDTGVILGLLYGLASVYYFSMRTITTKSYGVDPGAE